MTEILDPETPLGPPQTKRPFLLSILLILTFIGSGIGFILAIVVAIGGSLADFFNHLPISDTIVSEDAMGNLGYTILKVVVYIASLSGAVLMWKLRKPGFWLYFSAQVVLLGIPFLFLQSLGNHYLLTRLLINGIFTFFFIILYLLYLKKMK